MSSEMMLTGIPWRKLNYALTADLGSPNDTIHWPRPSIILKRGVKSHGQFSRMVYWVLRRWSSTFACPTEVFVDLYLLDPTCKSLLGGGFINL